METTGGSGYYPCLTHLRPIVAVKLLTLARDLQRRKGRERRNRFVAEGVRTVEALLASPLSVRGLLVSPAGLEEPRGAALMASALARRLPVVTVTEAELASAADTASPQGILAVADVPACSLPDPVPDRAMVLVLDALQDPGNVGTVIRTAAGLGVVATVALPGTVDPWNAKVVRSAMGALFHHPVVIMSVDACVDVLASTGFTMVAADTEGVPLSLWLKGGVPERVALVVSNEGAGLSSALARHVNRHVAIAMAPGVESLNVAVATGILLHGMRECSDASGSGAVEVATIRPDSS